MSGASPLLWFALAAVALTVATLAFVLRPLLRSHGRLIVCATVAGLALAPLLYLKLGASRALQGEHVVDAATTASTRAVADVREDLVAQLAHNPRDSRGWVLLARLELGSDRFAEAAAAYERALEHGKAANDTSLWCEYAEALALAQGGRLAGRPREIIGRALARDPTHARALELAGSAAVEAGEYRVAASYWRMLLAQVPDDSGEGAALRAALTKVELLAAVESKGGNLH
jgi:cytochrome c-type biogenesis protein CcmH